jgi:hypothetical protein
VLDVGLEVASPGQALDIAAPWLVEELGLGDGGQGFPDLVNEGALRVLDLFSTDGPGAIAVVLLQLDVEVDQPREALDGVRSGLPLLLGGRILACRMLYRRPSPHDC